MAAVVNSLGGIGHTRFRTLLHNLATAAASVEIAAGGSGRNANYTLANALQHQQAVLIRSNEESVRLATANS